MRWVEIGSALLLASGCKWGFSDLSDCHTDTEQPLDPTTVVNDPTLGSHAGRLTWLETHATTDLTVTVALDGPAFAATGCGSPYQVTVQNHVTSADGAIEVIEEQQFYVDHSQRLEDFYVNLDLDPVRLLASGVAPAEPNLLAQNPQIVLDIDPDMSSFTSGTVRALTSDEQITLGTITFGGGS